MINDDTGATPNVDILCFILGRWNIRIFTNKNALNLSIMEMCKIEPSESKPNTLKTAFRPAFVPNDCFLVFFFKHSKHIKNKKQQ